MRWKFCLLGSDECPEDRPEDRANSGGLPLSVPYTSDHKVYDPFIHRHYLLYSGIAIKIFLFSALLIDSIARQTANKKLH